MDEMLLELLNALEDICEDNSEITDTMAREEMSDQIFAGFICRRKQSTQHAT